MATHDEAESPTSVLQKSRTDREQLQVIREDIIRVPRDHQWTEFPTSVKSVIILGKLVHTNIGVGFLVCNFGDLFQVASLFFSSIYFSKRKRR